MLSFLHTALDVCLVVLACCSLGAIAFVAAGECSLRAKRRREATAAMDDVAPVPRVCLHPNETLSRTYAAKVVFTCLDCGETRVVGEVWFGASNKVKRGAT